VDDGVIDVGKSTNDVFKEEDAKFPTNDDIIVIILVLNETDGVLCTSRKKYMYILHKMSIGSQIEQKMPHVLHCVHFLRLIKTEQMSKIRSGVKIWNNIPSNVCELGEKI
jgi:hypothetical protein